MSELATTTQLEDIARSGSQILEKSTLRAEKAVTVGRTILETIEAEGMSAELDERCNKYLVNCRTAKGEMEVERKPITSFFDTIRKQFTEAEARVDATKADSIPAKIQSKRNEYVKQIREAEEKKRQEAQKKIDHDNEVIEIRANIERQFSEYMTNHTLTRKQNLQTSFNTITLADFEEKSKALKGLTPKYKPEHFHAFAPTVFPKHCTTEEVYQIKMEFMQTQEITLLAGVVEGELLKFKKELVEKLPSLKTSLDEMAAANEADQERMAKEKAGREKKEQEELQRKADEQALKEQELINQKKVSEQTEAMMNNLEVSGEGNAPESRSGFKIVVNHPGAFLEIVNFWFQKEGAHLSIPEIEKKTITQMMTFCQNYAHKNDEKITSKFLTYEPVYKAVNRK